MTNETRVVPVELLRAISLGHYAMDDLQALVGDLLAQPAAPVTTQEPVADVVMLNEEKIIDGTLHFMATAKVGTRLYTHADVGEVKRLRAKAEDLRQSLTRARKAHASSQGILQDRINALESQLAERDALLRKWRHGKNMTLKQCADLNERTDNALSASAEPSAPVERDPCPSCGVPGFTANCDKCIPY